MKTSDNKKSDKTKSPFAYYVELVKWGRDKPDKPKPEKEVKK